MPGRGGTWGFKGFRDRELEFPDASLSQQVSPVGRGRIRYNNVTKMFEASADGGAFAPLGGGTSPWQEAAGVISQVTVASDVVVGAAAMSGSEKFRVLGTSQKDLGVANQFLRTLTQDAFSRYEIWFTMPNSVLRLGADTADGDAFDADSEGIVVYETSANQLGRFKSDRFGLTRASDSSLYYYRVDQTALYYRANPPSGSYHFYVNRTTGWVGFGINTPAGSEALRVTGSALFDTDVTLDDTSGSASFLQLGNGSAAPVSGAANSRLRHNQVSGQLEASEAGGAYVPVVTGTARTMFFPAFQEDTDTPWRVRDVGDSSAESFTFIVPDEAKSITSVRAVGWPEAGATGSGKDIDLSSEYGAIGEQKDNHAETDTTSTYTIPAADQLFYLDLSSVFSSIAAGDKAGVEIQHNTIGGTIHYLGIELGYTV